MRARSPPLRYGLALLGTVQSGFLAAVAEEMPRAPNLTFVECLKAWGFSPEPYLLNEGLPCPWKLLGLRDLTRK